MPERGFNYDHPHYRVVRQHDAGVFDVASAVAFAHFRSRLNIVVHTIDIVVVSAASVASAIITLLHNASVFTMKTFDSANTIGRVATLTLTRTLASIGEVYSLMHTEGGGEYHVIYTYQVMPQSEVTVA